MLQTEEQHKSYWSAANKHKSRARVSHFNALIHPGLRLYILL